VLVPIVEVFTELGFQIPLILGVFVEFDGNVILEVF
jgi:hypothetical protein